MLIEIPALVSMGISVIGLQILVSGFAVRRKFMKARRATDPVLRQMLYIKVRYTAIRLMDMGVLGIAVRPAVQLHTGADLTFLDGYGIILYFPN